MQKAMTFAKSQIQEIAKLAKLALSDDEISRLGHDLSRIVDYVNQLREINVDDVKPMSHAGDRALSFRDDQVFKTLGRECIKSSAGFEDGLVRVPKIIE
jgi:aspartyl-tRNA(Asn)/glutamyl-tRNA(Gln) amidotransferase subunit C